MEHAKGSRFRFFDDRTWWQLIPPDKVTTGISRQLSVGPSLGGMRSLESTSNTRSGEAICTTWFLGGSISGTVSDREWKIQIPLKTSKSDPQFNEEFGDYYDPKFD
jgi:homoserine acetyltransferase